MIMLQNILKINGVKVLSKAEQKNVKGGRCGDGCDPAEQCCFTCGSSGCYWTFCQTGCPCNCV